MSSPNVKTRRFVLAMIAVAPLLAGCSFTPLYGDSENDGIAGSGFAYAEPTNRIEQIIYQELAFRLGKDTRPSAPLVTVSASTSERSVGRTSAGSVLTIYESVASATLSVDRREANPERVLSLSRFATASYEISGQVSADRFAVSNARENAARSVADTLRLILAAARKKGDI